MSSKALPRAVSLATQELKGIQLARSFLEPGVAPMAKSGGVLTLGPRLKVGGCLLTNLRALLIVSCPSSHPVQIVTVPLEMTNGDACQPLIYFNCHFSLPLAT